MTLSSIILIVSAEILLGILFFFLIKKGKIKNNPIFHFLKKEVIILFYALFRWKKLRHFDVGTQVFTYHKNSNYFWFFLALIHEQLIEMVVLHIYIKSEEPVLAIIILILHIYSVLYIMGDYNLVRNSPILIKQNSILINIGLRRELNFHIKDIELIQPAKSQYRSNGSIIHEKFVFHVTAMPRILTRIFGVTDEVQYEIVFKNPIQAFGYFGQKKEVRKVLLYIDEPDEFVKVLQELIDQSEEQQFIPKDITYYCKRWRDAYPPRI